jgi:hypothetical protein
VADHQEVERRLAARTQRRRGLVDDMGFRARGRIEFVQAGRLQHDQRIGQRQRGARAGVNADVAVQVGAGQHQQCRTAG